MLTNAFLVFSQKIEDRDGHRCPPRSVSTLWVLVSGVVAGEDLQRPLPQCFECNEEADDRGQMEDELDERIRGPVQGRNHHCGHLAEFPQHQPNVDEKEEPDDDISHQQTELLEPLHVSSKVEGSLP